MSSTVATLAGTTGSGFGSGRHIVKAVNDDQYWAFGLTSTATLASWSSPDGLTWTAQGTHTLGHNHEGEGRNLSVGYLNANGIDIFHIVYAWKNASNAVIPATLRASVQSGVITYHSTETDLQNPTSGSGDSGALYYVAPSCELDTNQRVYVSGRVNGSGTYAYDQSAVRSTVDPGTAESSTPVTWTTYDIDSSDATQSRSSVLVSLGSGNMGLLSDDGASSSGTTGISWYTWNGSTWSGSGGNQAATGSISSIGKNDWSAVRVSDTDVHLVYRSGSSSFVHRRYNGSSWGAGQSIPTQANLADGGIALATDGVSVVMSIIDTDAANTVRTITWDGASWGLWTVVEESTATRTYIGCAEDLVKNTLLTYWTEGSDLVVGAVPTFADPPGPSTRVAVSHQPCDSAASSTTLTITFDGTQPNAGNKIVCMFWGAVFSGSPTVTSVKDNCTDVGGGHTFTAGPLRLVASTQGIWSAWLDLPVSAVWSGNYAVTVTMSASLGEFDGGAVAYSGVTAGAPTATNNNAGTGTAATAGAVNPSSGLSTYVMGLTDASGSNPATETYPSSFTRQIAQTNGSTQQVGAIGDAINITGSQNPSVTIDSVAWLAIAMAWVNANLVVPPTPKFPAYEYMVPQARYSGWGATRLRMQAIAAQPRRIVYAPGGQPNQFQVTLNVDASSVVSMSKAVSKTFLLGSTSSASLTKQVSKTLSVASSSSVSLLKTVGKVLSVATTSAATLTKQIGKLLSVATSSSLTLTKQVGKILSVATSPAVSLTKRIGKTFSVAASSSVTLTAIRTKLVTLSVATSSSVSMVKQVGKNLAVATASQVSMRRSIGKMLSVGTSSSVSMVKAIGKTLSVATTSALSLIAQVPSLGTLLRYVVDSVRPSTAASTQEPTSSLIDTEPPSGQDTKVKGQ